MLLDILSLSGPKFWHGTLQFVSSFPLLFESMLGPENRSPAENKSRPHCDYYLRIKPVVVLFVFKPVQAISFRLDFWVKVRSIALCDMLSIIIQDTQVVDKKAW